MSKANFEIFGPIEASEVEKIEREMEAYLAPDEEMMIDPETSCALYDQMLLDDELPGDVPEFVLETEQEKKTSQPTQVVQPAQSKREEVKKAKMPTSKTISLGEKDKSSSRLMVEFEDQKDDEGNVIHFPAMTVTDFYRATATDFYPDLEKCIRIGGNPGIMDDIKDMINFYKGLKEAFPMPKKYEKGEVSENVRKFYIKMRRRNKLKMSMINMLYRMIHDRHIYKGMTATDILESASIEEGIRAGRMCYNLLRKEPFMNEKMNGRKVNGAYKIPSNSFRVPMVHHLYFKKLQEDQGEGIKDVILEQGIYPGMMVTRKLIRAFILCNYDPYNFYKGKDNVRFSEFKLAMCYFYSSCVIGREDLFNDIKEKICKVINEELLSLNKAGYDAYRKKFQKDYQENNQTCFPGKKASFHTERMNYSEKTLREKLDFSDYRSENERWRNSMETRKIAQLGCFLHVFMKATKGTRHFKKYFISNGRRRKRFYEEVNDTLERRGFRRLGKSRITDLANELFEALSIDMKAFAKKFDMELFNEMIRNYAEWKEKQISIKMKLEVLFLVMDSKDFEVFTMKKTKKKFQILDDEMVREGFLIYAA